LEPGQRRLKTPSRRFRADTFNRALWKIGNQMVLAKQCWHFPTGGKSGCIFLFREASPA
jgi:hypothetical protein